jgi:hypothetical protein
VVEVKLLNIFLPTTRRRYIMMTRAEALHKVEQQFRKLKEVVEQALDVGSRIDEVERELFGQLLAMGHSMLSVFVAESGDGDVGKTVEKEGRTLIRLAEKHSQRYVSIFGELNIERFVYAVRERQKIELAPLDAALGLPAGEVSYLLEEWLERMCLKESFGEGVTSLGDLLGVTVSVDTAETHNRAVAEHAESYRLSLPTPPAEEEGEILVVTADAKGVPMRRPVSAEPALASGKRRGKGEKAHKKQMAYVGAVYTISRFERTADKVIDEILRKECAAQRPRPQHKHLWVEMSAPGDPLSGKGARHGPSYLFLELALDCAARDPQRKKKLVCLFDGEKQLWDQTADWLARGVGILDIFHVMERLWTVAHCLHREKSPGAEQFVTRHLKMLLEGKVGWVIGSFRRLLTTTHLPAQKRRRISATITYFDNNRQHMRYDEYLAAGYPIGSGVAEGACRHLVKDRLEQTGMRWTRDGAHSLLQLRAIYLNGDWKAFIQHRIQREQAALYGQAA